MNLRISTPAEEGVYQGAKWLKFQVLCSEEEMRSLFLLWEPFEMFPLTGIVNGKPIEKGSFLTAYGEWIEALKKGRAPLDQELRKYLAAVLVRDESALWLQEIAGKGHLVKIGKPCVQMQASGFTYSPIDEVFRPMSMGMGSIFWGIQFSFPQIYQDPKTMEIREVDTDPLFETLRLWVREATRSTPFLVEGKRVNVPIRIGKTCLSWIDAHPQLKEQKIGVFHAAN